MGKAIRASLLVLLLCSIARAGHIPNDAPAPPPLEPATATELQVTTEDETQDALPGTVTQIALELLAVLPSLF